jgi:hypothetical protein
MILVSVQWEDEIDGAVIESGFLYFTEQWGLISLLTGITHNYTGALLCVSVVCRVSCVVRRVIVVLG